MKNRILIDTHVFLWLFLEPRRFSSAAIKFVKDTRANKFFFSDACAWETSIKFGVGKLILPKAPQFFIPERVRRAGYTHLPIELEHVLHVHDLPEIHRDPFDRLLVSQAKLESMVILTADPIFKKYNIQVINFSDIC